MIEFEEVEVTQKVDRVKRLVCDNCSAEIEQVSSESAAPKQGMFVHLCGGYAEYFDGDARVLFCKACSDGLCQAYPCIAKAINDAN